MTPDDVLCALRALRLSGRMGALPVLVAGTSITAVFMAARSFARQSRQSSCLLLKGTRCGAD